MKKHILLCLLCFCFYEMSYAQMYLKGYTGYALSTGNTKLTSSIIINNDKYASSYRLKAGQGLNLGLGIGYDLNRNIAFEITGNTQLCSKFNYSPYQWDYNFTDGGSYSYEGFFDDFEYTNSLFQVSPQVVFKSNPCNQWTFYLKGGPDFIWIKHKRTTYDESLLMTEHFSGKINTGIQCSFGTEYELSKNIRVFAELTTVGVKYTFRKNKILRYEKDGVDALSELDSNFFDNLNDKVIFNHAGLNVGIKYAFR